MMRFATAALLLAATASPLVGQAVPADAYADPLAREMVQRARERRELVDRSIEAYEVTATERISAGHRLLLRERLLYRRESASRVRWQKDGPVEIEVLGAREVIPVAVELPQIPGDLDAYMGSMAFDPMNAHFLLNVRDSDLHNPLEDGSEAHYRFATGDSTTLVLPGGRRVRLRELRIQPRRREPTLISGSYWFDVDSYAVVQAVFRLARPWNLTDEDDDVPGFLGGIEAELSHVAVEYGLWEQRWWLPRLVSAAGTIKLGMFGTLPMEFERRYEQYYVRGDTLRAMEVRDSTTRSPCRRTTSFQIGVGVEDSVRMERARARVERQRIRHDSTVAVYDSLVAAGETPEERPCQPFFVAIPDSIDVLNSPWLPSAGIYAGETLMAESELRELMDRVENLPGMDWGVARPDFEWGFGGSGLVRYNRVEALAVGARAGVDLGRAQVAGVVRYGVADEKVSGELSFARETVQRSWRLRGYHQLMAMDPATSPFSLGSSLNALLIGRDDAQYYRGFGAALEVLPAAARDQWWGARAYVERQMPVRRNTDFSVRHLLDGDAGFRPVVPADRADQVGAEVTLQGQLGENPDGLRAGAELTVRGETGDFQFGRESLRLRATFPLPRRVTGAVEVAGGVAAGDVPAQSEWYMGGPATLRGYPTATLAGPAFWRGRAEVGFGPPFVRLTLFGDAAWAGERDDMPTGRALLSAGAGASVLDGILRLDLARALRAPTGWRLHLYLDAIL